jgi:hypothetical protein
MEHFESPNYHCESETHMVKNFSNIHVIFQKECLLSITLLINISATFCYKSNAREFDIGRICILFGQVNYCLELLHNAPFQCEKSEKFVGFCIGL